LTSLMIWTGVDAEAEPSLDATSNEPCIARFSRFSTMVASHFRMNIH
jgi:hypothetical protein